MHAAFGFQWQQRGERIVACRRNRLYAQLAKLADFRFRRDVVYQRRIQRGAHARLHRDRLTRLPLEQLVVMGDAADDIGQTAPQIALAVAVKIHREFAVAAGHELRDAHRAGVRAF